MNIHKICCHECTNISFKNRINFDLGDFCVKRISPFSSLTDFADLADFLINVCCLEIEDSMESMHE